MDRVTNRQSNANRLGRSAVFLAALILPLMALGLLLFPAAPAAASCGGTTVVSNEAEYDSAITDFNSQGAGCVFTIELAGEVDVFNAPPDITNAAAGTELVVNGNGHSLYRPGGAAYRLMTLQPGTVVTTNQLGIRNGRVETAIGLGGAYDPAAGGGILALSATLTLNEGDFSDNQAVGLAGDPAAGGALYGVDSVITITAGDFKSNRAIGTSTTLGSMGGGIGSDGGTVTILDSLIAYNEVGDATLGIGGGVGTAGLTDFDGTLIIANSTIYQNNVVNTTPTKGGSGLAAGTATGLVNSTVYQNSNAAGLTVYGPAIAIYNTISAGNNTGDCELVSGVVDIQYSLMQATGAGACGLPLTNGGISGNWIGHDPLLGDLSDNGGSTYTLPFVSSGTFALNRGNDALAAIPSGPLTSDQRQAPYVRKYGPVDIGAYELQCPSSPVLVATEDELTAAIACYNLIETTNTIYTILFDADITLTTQLPFISNINNPANNVSLVIDGQDHTLAGNYPDGSFDALTAIGDDLTVEDLTVSRFSSAIRSDGGNLIVTRSTLADGFAGVFVVRGTAVVRDSTLRDNALGVVANNGGFSVINSTVARNETGIAVSNNNVTALLTNTTVADNTSQGVSNYGTITINNSILAGNDEDCVNNNTATINFSLIQDPNNACGLAAGNPVGNGNIVGENPILGPLGLQWGGKTETMPLLQLTGSVNITSPAVDVGDNALALDENSAPLALDQRNLNIFPRIRNLIVDMGAVEGPFGVNCPTFPITVNDEDQLNEAIQCYNFATTVGNYTINLGSDIDLSGSTLPVDNPIDNIELTLDGDNHTVDGLGASGVRPFTINIDSDVTLQDITVTGGNADLGGGISNEGTLTVLDSVVTANTANGVGNGIFNTGDLTVVGSEISSNTGGFFGGGIANGGTLNVTLSTIRDNESERGAGIGSVPNIGNGQGGQVVNNVTNSAILDNIAEGAGGGIYLERVSGAIANTTLNGNRSGEIGGGIANINSVLTVNNSTLVDNRASDVVGGGGIMTGSFCFTADVEVLLADGTTKRIADVVVGDQLVSYDFHTQQQVTTTVDGTISHEVDSYLRINDLEVTSEHPFAVGPDQWLRAGDLKLGDKVIDQNGGWTTIQRIEEVNETVDVYTISVDGPENYYVTDGSSTYLVHNKQISLAQGETAINNTIITQSTAPNNADCAAEGGGAFLGSNNLIDDFAAGDCSGISSAAVTNLGALANNGGPTMTHALLAGSNAINTGANGNALDPEGQPLTTDQRGVGFPRIVDTTVDVGAYEYMTPPPSLCPVDPNVGPLLTTVLGVGQGSPTKGIRTRKLVIPNYQDVASLYGQLASVESGGVMKYVRFRYPNNTKVQIYAPTSPAYRTFAVNWWGAELDTGYKYVKGQFFWGAKGNKTPRAFVLWPTYNTTENYANVFTTFDESIKNHVAWESGFNPSVTQVVAIPETQANGAVVTVSVAVVDVNKDGRTMTLTVEAGGVSVARVLTVPNSRDLLNLEEFVLENVPVGTDKVTITLESPNGTGDSAAMIGAAVNYECSDTVEP